MQIMMAVGEGGARLKGNEVALSKQKNKIANLQCQDSARLHPPKDKFSEKCRPPLSPIPRELGKSPKDLCPTGVIGGREH